MTSLFNFLEIHCLFVTRSLTFRFPTFLRSRDHVSLPNEGDRLPMDESLPTEDVSSPPLIFGRGGGTGFFQPIVDAFTDSGLLVLLKSGFLISVSFIYQQFI